MRNKIPSRAHLMIIGAMKCGTTSLYHYLESHPEICGAKTKEPEYFSGFNADIPKPGKYEDLFDFDPSAHKYAMEGSTGYTKYPSSNALDVPKRIHEYGIRPKLIYIVRNPFDRVVSHYNANLKWKKEVTRQHFIETSKYCQQLELFRQYFPREDLLLLDFNELKKDPRIVLRKAYKFLGLREPVFPDHFKTENKTPSLTEAEIRIQELGIIPSPAKKIAQGFVRRFSNTRKYELTQDEKGIIFRALREDMFKFEDEYKFDVSQWGFVRSSEEAEREDALNCTISC
ncbi:sulfotransferase domain-containing protein [Puniceicoccaceae bacterium K14]|nr:sulfotransferase domain-containing protein [Puniceicoccaceae bacterium K14]